MQTVPKGGVMRGQEGKTKNDLSGSALIFGFQPYGIF